MLREKLVFSIAIVAAALFCGTPAHAQRTWVSGVGDDVNPCSRTAPCKTFAGAISKTAAGSEINCLDPGGFGAVTITKSITIDCHEVFASVLVSGTNGINIVSDNAAAPVVRLRNLNITGVSGGGLTGINITGANSSNTTVILEDIMIDGFSQKGVNDARAGGKLFITNSTIRDNTQAGVTVGTVKATIDRLRSFNNAFGVAVATGGVAMINNSTLAGNTSAGLETEGSALALVDNTVISGNAIGIQVVGGTVNIGNSDIAFNPTGVSGTIHSFVNNRFFQNGAGGTISPVGVTSNPSGQQ